MGAGVAELRTRRFRLTLTEAVVLLSVVVFIGLGIARLLYPYDIGEYEANAWAPAVLLTHLHNPYTQSLALHQPYVASAYGPLYYAVVGLGARVFGYQFWFARLLSICAGALAATLIYRITTRFTMRRSAGLLAVGLFTVQWPVMAWAGVQRPDLLGLACVLVGLDLALRRDDDRPLQHAGWAGIALLAALLTRQTYLLPPLFVAAWYLATRERAALVCFLTTFLATGAALLALLDITSHGGFIASLVTNQEGAASSLAQLRSNVQAVLESPAAWVVALGVPLMTVLVVRRRRTIDADMSSLTMLLVTYTALATVLAAVTSARAGANVNYFIEPVAIGSLTLGVGSQLVAPTHRRRIGLLVTVLVACAAAEAAARQGHGQLDQWRSKPYFNAVVAELQRIPRSSGPMLSSYPELVADAGRTEWVNDFVQYDGRSPQLRAALVRIFRERRLSAIVWAEPPPPGYVQVHLDVPRPSGVYVVNVYVRKDLAARLNGTTPS